MFGAICPAETTSVVENWYDYKGDANAYNNPEATDATGDSYEGVE